MRYLKWWERVGVSEQVAVSLQGQLRKFERNIQGSHSITDNNVADKFNKKRHSSKLRRSILKEFSRPLPRNLSVKQLLLSQRDSALLDGLCENRSEKWLSILEREPRGEVQVENFSFLDFPIETMQTLQKIVDGDNRFADVKVNFKDPTCLDIGSMLVFEEMWRKLSPVFTGGLINDNTSRVIELLGLRKQMGWKPLVFSEDSDPVAPFIFRRQERPDNAERSMGIEPSRSLLVAYDLVNFIDLTLKNVCSAKLSKDGRASFLSLVGEVLDNAGTHATEDKRGGFTISGFVVKRTDGDGEVFRFHLGFLSMGNSISKSLENPPPQIKPNMDHYIRLHLGVNGLTEENLRTVYAIRDGITRLHEKIDVIDGKSLGGTGLADILDFFSKLSLIARTDKKPQLAIVSGNTYISVKEPYSQARRQRGDSEDVPDQTVKRELWFNEKNTPDEPPDVEHVIALPCSLAGTLVTLAFDIDPDLMVKVEK